MSKDYFVHESSYVDEGAEIGEGTKIWHFSHIMNNSKIGKNCNLGQNVVISPHVVLGDSVKVQNNVSVYTGVLCDEGVFLGPSCVFTNVHKPRSLIEKKDEYLTTHLKKGATIGANATVICGNTIGKFALVGAGTVVTRDIKDYEVVVGNPQRHLGYACECGERLPEDLKCLICHREYEMINDKLKEKM